MLRQLFSLLILFCALPVFSQRIERFSISNDIEVFELADSVFIHISYLQTEANRRTAANGIIVIRNGQALLVDSPWNDKQTTDLCRWLSDSLQVQIVAFIPTHWHEDCMGGLNVIRQLGIPAYANQMTAGIATIKGLPVPDRLFHDSLSLYIGDKEVECYYPGPAHSIDNIVVWIPGDKLLFTGCLAKSTDSRNLGNTKDGDLKAYPASVKNVLEHYPDIKTVVPGHGGFGGKEILYHTLDLASGR